MNRILILVLIFLGTIGYLQAQTFQYSRGWTNGKRSGADSGSLKQMTSNKLAQVLTANDLSNRERLIQHILKSPCDRMALLSRNLKSSEDYPLSSVSEGIEDDLSTRFKREIVQN